MFSNRRQDPDELSIAQKWDLSVGRAVRCVSWTQGAKRLVGRHLDFSYVQEEFVGRTPVGGEESRL